MRPLGMSFSLKTWTIRWGPALLVMVIIFAASATPGSDLPQFGVLDFSFKKGGHALGYALLALGYLRGLSYRRTPSRTHLALAVTFSFLYAMTDEYHQSFTPGRNSSPIDVMLDTVGAAFGVVIWNYLLRGIFTRLRSDRQVYPPDERNVAEKS
jgi:VanZ family protein